MVLYITAGLLMFAACCLWGYRDAVYSKSYGPDTEDVAMFLIMAATASAAWPVLLFGGAIYWGATGIKIWLHKQREEWRNK
jgi:hypothetical protein